MAMIISCIIKDPLTWVHEVDLRCMSSVALSWCSISGISHSLEFENRKCQSKHRSKYHSCDWSATNYKITSCKEFLRLTTPRHDLLHCDLWLTEDGSEIQVNPIGASRQVWNQLVRKQRTQFFFFLAFREVQIQSKSLSWVCRCSFQTTSPHVVLG